MIHIKQNNGVYLSGNTNFSPFDIDTKEVVLEFSECSYRERFNNTSKAIDCFHSYNKDEYKNCHIIQMTRNGEHKTQSISAKGIINKTEDVKFLGHTIQFIGDGMGEYNRIKREYQSLT